MRAAEAKAAAKAARREEIARNREANEILYGERTLHGRNLAKPALFTPKGKGFVVTDVPELAASLSAAAAAQVCVCVAGSVAAFSSTLWRPPIQVSARPASKRRRHRCRRN